MSGKRQLVLYGAGGFGREIAWLAEDPGAEEWRGKMVIAPKLCNKLGLLPGWKPGKG